MEYAVKRIGVLTSGGDAPGMNAAIRAVARTATRLGIECVGIRRGWNGLINGDILPLDAGSVRSIINRGGTMLYTARSEEFRTEEGQKKAANTAVECIDRLRDTMQSHERCSVVEVMGRHAGYLALYVGMAVGATAVLVPEEMFDFEAHVAEKIRRARLGGKTNFMIVVAEGAASAVEVGRQIQEELGLDPRVTILGHIQRGGSPTAKDRVMATRMGYEAVHLLAAGKTNRVVCARGDSIVDVDINDGLAMHKTLNSEEYEVMEAMTGI